MLARCSGPETVDPIAKANGKRTFTDMQGRQWK